MSVSVGREMGAIGPSIVRESYPYNFTYGEEGVRARSYIELKGRTFRTGIVSGYYAKLERIKAPTLNCDGYCELENCTFEVIRTKYYCECVNSRIRDIFGESYATIKNSIIDQRVKSSQYVDVDLSEIKEIDCKSYVCAKRSIIEAIKSNEYADLSNCEVLGDSTSKYSVISDSYVNAANSILKSIKSDYYVKLKDTTVLEEVNCDSFEGDGTTVDSIIGKTTLNMIGCTSRLISGETIVCCRCPSLEVVNATASASLKDCENIHSVRALELVLKNCRVLDIADGTSVKVINTVIENRLLAANNELRIVDSHVNHVFMKSPIHAPALLDGESGDFGTPDIAPLVRAVEKGQVRISIERGEYKLYFGPSKSKYPCRMGINNVTILSDHSCSIIGGRIIAGEVVLSSEIVFNKAKIKKALDFIQEKRERPPMVVDEAVKSGPKPQTVIVLGGHVEVIEFEMPGGVVLLEKGATVGRIINGSDPMLKETAEPPEEFIDPIFMEVMSDPRRTPLKHVFDYKTLVRLADPKTKIFTCPLTRQIFNLVDCKADVELKEAIEEWLKTHRPA